MHDHAMDGWDWVWMGGGMMIALLVFGALAYGAVSLALRHARSNDK